MGLPQEVIELENRSLGFHGEPTLARAFKLLLQDWDAGTRSRESGLHLLFLSWYLMLEPPHLTGLELDDSISAQLGPVFNRVHDYFAGTLSNDAEMLYVVGLMAHLTPWLLGEVDKWESLSAQYRILYRQLAPNGLDPNLFRGRGAYGDYFGHQAGIKDGY